MQKSKTTIIAGPCSAETYEQLTQVYHFLSDGQKADYIRCGIWKPRSRAGSFEGKGTEALKWIQQISRLYEGPPWITEVALPEHIELCLKHDIRTFWIGARTTTNPFLVQELAETLRGVPKTEVWIKNPMHPDWQLWLGAIERFEKAGTKTSAIHRGFYSKTGGPYRNDPYWSVPLQLKSLRPELTIICDASHIAGNRDRIPEIVLTSRWLELDGLMLEVHPNPEAALSDKDQQLTFKDFLHLLQSYYSFPELLNKHTPQEISQYRSSIDKIDFQIIELLKKRMQLVEQIGEIKKIFHIPVFQMERWLEILQTRTSWAGQTGLPAGFIQRVFELIHNESILLQNQMMMDEKNNVLKEDK